MSGYRVAGLLLPDPAVPPHPISLPVNLTVRPPLSLLSDSLLAYSIFLSLIVMSRLTFHGSYSTLGCLLLHHILSFVLSLTLAFLVLYSVPILVSFISCYFPVFQSSALPLSLSLAPTFPFNPIFCPTFSIPVLLLS